MKRYCISYTRSGTRRYFKEFRIGKESAQVIGALCSSEALLFTSQAAAKKTKTTLDYYYSRGAHLSKCVDFQIVEV